MGVVERTDEAAGWDGARVFVATTTSGLAASMSWTEKLTVWNELGEWVIEQRKHLADDAINGEETI